MIYFGRLPGVSPCPVTFRIIPHDIYLFRLIPTPIKLIVKYYVEKVENSSYQLRKVEMFSTFQLCYVKISPNTAIIPPEVWITVIAHPLKSGEVSFISHRIFSSGTLLRRLKSIPEVI